ncbi:MAG TPA: hypothetical protein VKU77_01270 [Streptosporangiaceae bacterium]|nr:hypothetical protein [Streptosporangiaceae bacterium]
MRLYPLAGDVLAVDDAEHGHIEPAGDGGFDFPGPLSERMHAMHVNGHRQWETAVERQHRLIAEEAARRADPATLLAAVEQLVKAAEASPPQAAPEPGTPARRAAPRRAAAEK